jgi:hypothetical protein
MPMEPVATPNAAQPKSRRRWYQYSLPALLIFVTLAGCGFGWLGWQARVVQQRRAFLNNNGDTQVWFKDSPDALSWVRRLLGDSAVDRIGLPFKTDKAERRRLATIFPEAQILAIPASQKNPELYWSPSGHIQIIYEPLVRFPDETPAPSKD